MWDHPIFSWLIPVSNYAVRAGATLLIHSTVILFAGLMGAYALKARGAVAQSTVLRIFCAAFLLGTPVSLLLHEAGYEGMTVTVPLTMHHKPVDKAVSQPVNRNISATNGGPISHAPSQQVKTSYQSKASRNDKTTSQPEKKYNSLPVRSPRMNTTPSTDKQVTAIVRTDGKQKAVSSPGTIAVLYVLLTLAWFVMALIVLARLLLSNLILLYVRYTAVQAKPSFLDASASAARELSIDAPVVLQSPIVTSPFAAGIFRPYIVLPMGKHETGLPEKEVFLHELAHLKRHDPFWNLLVRLIRIIIPYQPLIWVYSRRLAITSDYVCDDYVMNSIESHRSYASSLALLARHYHPRGHELVAGAGYISVKSSLRSRIERILDATHRISLRVSARLVIHISVLCAFITFVTGFIGIKGKNSVHESFASEKKPDKQPGDKAAQPRKTERPVQAADKSSARYVKQTIDDSRKAVTQQPDNTESEPDGAGNDTSISASIPPETFTASVIHHPNADESSEKSESTRMNAITAFEPEPVAENTVVKASETPTDANAEENIVIEPEKADTVVNSSPGKVAETTVAFHGAFDSAGSSAFENGAVNDLALKTVEVVISYDFDTADLSDPGEIKEYSMFKSLQQNKMHPVWSPDGKWIAFSDDKYGVWMVPADGGEPRLVYDNYYKVEYEEYELQISGLEPLGFTPDGSEVTFIKYGIDENLGTEVVVDKLRQPVQITVNNPIPVIVSVNIANGLSRVIARNATSGRWSYDGRYFTYARKNADSFKELVINDTMTGLERTVDDLLSVPMYFPMSDPFLLFSDCDIYRVQNESKVLEQLEFAENITISDISPDGKWILYTEENGSSKQIVYNTKTGEQRDVFSDASIQPQWAKFSPDGEKICFCLQSDDTEENGWTMYLCDAEYSDGRQIDVDEEIPHSFDLTGNFPNPFNASTTIKFSLPENGLATIDIYNIMGQKVRALISEQITSGVHTIVWDGRDDSGRKVSSGTYISVLTAGVNTATGRMMLVK